PHRHMTKASARILLWVCVQIEHDCATGIGGDWSTKAPDAAFLNEAILDFGGENVFEFIHPHHGEVLVERVRATTTRRLAGVGKQKSCLVDAVDVGGPRDKPGDLQREVPLSMACQEVMAERRMSLMVLIWPRYVPVFDLRRRQSETLYAVSF